MALTDTAIKKLKATGARYRVTDHDNLVLEVTPAGNKIWRYRFNVNGKSSNFTLGDYPAMSLKEARTLKEHIKGMVQKGINPNEHRKSEQERLRAEEAIHKQKESALTVSGLYEEFAKFKTTQFGERKPDWSYETLQKHNLRIKKHVVPMLGDKSILDVDEHDLEDCLLHIQDHGTLVNRNKILTVFKLMFKYAKGKKYIVRDPSLYISDALFVKHKAKPYKHVTTPNELKSVLLKINSIQATHEVKMCLLIGVHIFVRPSELAGMKWHEVDFENREIHLATTKGAITHDPKMLMIPMSDQVMEMLKHLNSITGYSQYVFLSPYGRLGHISRDSMSNALRRNGITEINPHGFRHTASTALNNLGFNADEIELQLNHTIGGVRGIYNKAEKLEQRRKMMQAWSDYLDSLSECFEQLNSEKLIRE